VLTATGGRRAENVIEKVRLVKSREEIAWLEKAGALTDAAIEAAAAVIRPGARDYDIAAASVGTLTAGGSEFFCIDPIVCAGWRSGTPHSNRGGSIVEAGDPVFLEMGATLARYTCPIMRTRVAGTPSPELAELAAYSSDCLAAMIDTIRPGVLARDVAAAGRKVLLPILDKVAFHHVYGYSLGIAYPPTWIENGYFFLMAHEETPIEAGMVFHLPLTLRRLGRYGAGFSEAVEVTAGGARIFSRLPRSLAG
jgi:Xaa-Pro aminopeptidase